MNILEVQNLRKRYRLGYIGYGTLYKDIQRWWALKWGKKDPNETIIDQGISRVNIGKEGIREFDALQGVSFSVKVGEILGVIGKNGAGKSTLLKILSRVTLPTDGEVRFRGRISSLLEVGTGFHPELTGRENVFLNGAILGMTHAEIRQKFDQISEFAGIGEYIDTPIKRYSSGMTVRLGFSVAAHLEPEILIVDEVLAVGDAEFQKKCINKMNDLGGHGQTILFVSHNMNTIRRLCTRTIVMDEGRVVFDGNTDKAIEYYNKLTSVIDGGESVQVIKENLPVQIVAAKLLNLKGEVVNEISYSEEFYLQFTLDVKTPNRDYKADFHILNEKEIFVLSGTDLDFDTESVKGWNLKEGEVVFRIKIPGKLLKPGKYRFGCSIGNRYLYTISALEKKVAFEVIDTESKRAVESLYAPDAVVAPELFWERI